MGEGQKIVFDRIVRWDGIEDNESIGALFFHVFIKQLITNVYGDEFALLCDGYLDAYMSLKYLTHRKIRELFTTGESLWLDDIKTKKKSERLDDMILSSLKGSYNYIVENYGENKSNWKWGDAHALTHRHVLSKVKILDYLFSLNVGPFKSGGSSLTPNAGGYSFRDGFKQTSGASMRRIVDFSDLNRTKMILPTGQSGLHKSINYKDQAELYHSGGYRTTRFYESYIRRSIEFDHLRFLPNSQ